MKFLGQIVDYAVMNGEWNESMSSKRVKDCDVCLGSGELIQKNPFISKSTFQCWKCGGKGVVEYQ